MDIPEINSAIFKTTRRKVLRLLGTLGLTSTFAAQGCGQNDSDITTDKAQNFITEENKNEGTTDWQLTRVRVDGSKYRTKLIEGYCSHQSISKGEKINFYVSTDPGRDFTLDIYRMGYYEGKGGRHMMNIGPLKGTSQAVPEKTSLPEQLRECNWTSSHSMVIPDDWLSGVYLGKLKTIPISGEDPYWESYIIFIVKDDRQADVLFQCSDNTWQAYNRWPENESLYTHPQGAHIPGVSVSFNRPYGMYCQIFEHPLSMGSGEFLLWEYPLCFWLEKNGYDVTYGSNRDCINIDFIRRCFTFLSVGHDEYWDIEQYNAVKEAINMGTNVLWLSGNSVFMVSPFSNDAQGNPGRRLTRQGSYGELRAEELASYHELFGNLREAAPDERDIMGVRSVVPFNGGGDWICTNPDHWIFKGTGMKKGDFIPGLVGWEHHGDPDFNKPGLEILAEGMIWSSGDVPGKYASVIFNGPQNNFVFNASTIFWSQALSQPPGHILPWSHWSRPHGTDQRVQQIMHNLLAKKG